MVVRPGPSRFLLHKYSMTVIPALFVLLPFPPLKLTSRAECTSSGRIAAEQLAGPMTLTWLPLTTQGFMVADYISTSIVPGDDDATPVFEVARPPTGTSSCSNLSTGAPGQNCHQATFTSSEDVLKI